MTYDLLKIFGKYFQDEKVVIDSYELTDGYYYVIDENNNFEKLQVLNNESMQLVIFFKKTLFHLKEY